MKTVLVLGANGQLGKSFQQETGKDSTIDWLYMDSSELDITNSRDIQEIFYSKQIDYCINCAAYTNVEKAESEDEKAFLINAQAVKDLASICKKNNAILIHFSTDYVFPGTSIEPYKEDDKTSPLNVYGASKLKGEEYIRQYLDQYYIFRISWLYSAYGHNFFKTVVNKAREGQTLNITTAQTGTPTNAHHLARFVIKLIKNNNRDYGVYHYSNGGETTWYGFAEEIVKTAGQLDKVTLNKDDSYKTIATRPAYSVLDKSKLKNVLGEIPVSWQTAVKELYKNYSKD